MNSPLIDPFRLWRDAVTKLETDLNAMANSGMASPQFAAVLHRYTEAMVGAQHMFEKVLRATLAKLDLPSRSEMAELTASLQRLENKLDLLLPADAVAPHAPRPARTRRPPEEAAADPAAPAQAPESAAKPKRAAKPAAKARAEHTRKPARTRS